MSDNYHYEDGAKHYDHKKVLHIDNIGSADVKKLISAFFKEDAEDAEVVEEVKKDASGSVIQKRRTPKKLKGQQKQTKPRVTMTFKRKSNVLDGHLSLLFMKLQGAEWIDGNEADFKALFSGKMDEDCVITWKKTFGKSTLVELFKQLVGTGLVIVPDGFTIPAILEGHFKDEEGEWLTNLDKGDKANDKALPLIAECVKMMKADPHTLLNGGLDDDDGYDDGYDPFDHLDLQYHTR